MPNLKSDRVASNQQPPPPRTLPAVEQRDCDCQILEAVTGPPGGSARTTRTLTPPLAPATAFHNENHGSHMFTPGDQPHGDPSTVQSSRVSEEPQSSGASASLRAPRRDNDTTTRGTGPLSRDTRESYLPVYESLLLPTPTRSEDGLPQCTDRRPREASDNQRTSQRSARTAQAFKCSTDTTLDRDARPPELRGVT